MMIKNISLVMIMAIIAFSQTTLAGDTPSSNSASVYFINIKDGDIVTNPVTIQFGLKGMGVSPAGVKNIENSGHHHLLINSELSTKGFDTPIPSDEKHRHFGKGQTETTLDLPQGALSLQLVLGDWKHTPHDRPVVSELIKITVE